MSANDEINAKLVEVRDRIRRVQLTRGALITATIALAGLLLIMAADFIFAPLPGIARWGLFIVWIATTIYAAKAGFAPYFRKIGLVQIARWIEVRHPEIQERMSTVMELARHKSNASTDLIEALGLAAHHDVESVNPDLEIKSAATKKKWARPAMAMAVVLALVLVIWPSQSGRLLVRAMAPFSDLGNAGAASFEIKPGNIEVLEGDPVTITVEYEGSAKTIALWIELEGKKPFSQTLTRSGKTFTYRLNPAIRSFRYYAQSGRAQSDTFDVKVWSLPEMLEPRLTLGYREYTGLSERTVPLGNGIEDVEGTMVTLFSPTNSALEAAWIEVDGNRLSEAKLETSSTGGRVAFSWRLTRENAGLAVVTAKHHLGRELQLARFPIEVLPDIDPQVVLASPAPEEIKVRFDERVPLRYEVAEDFAIAKVELEIDAGGDRQTSFPLDLPLRRSRSSKPAMFDGAASVAVGKIRATFPGINEARVRITATDNRPDDLSNGPGVGSSRWLKLKFEQNAESLARQELREEHEGAREKIEDAIRKAREAKDELASLREEVKKEEMPDWAQEKFEKANAKLADAQEKAEELAQQMDDSIHASKADKVEQAAEKLKEALAKAESAPLQDDAEKRKETLDSAKKATEEAIANLEKVRDDINKDQQRVEDLARFQELAQKQEELARQAEESLNMPMTEEQLAEWKKQQEQMERQLAEQLKKRPEALAQALAEQAKQAEQLAQDAGELAENQKQLQQQAEQQAQAEPISTESLEDAIKQALAEEQQSIANEAQAQLDKALSEQSDIADTLPEATAEANEALSQIKENDPAAAAESAEQAAQAMQEASEMPATPASAAKAAQEASAAQEKSAEAADQAAKAEKAAAESGTPEAAQAAAESAEAAQAAAEQASEASAAAEQAAAQAGEPEAAQAAAEAAAKAESAAETAAEAASQAEAAAQTAAEASAAAEEAATGEASAAEAAAKKAESSKIAAAEAATAATTAETASAEAAKSAAEAAQASAEATAAQAAEMAASGEAPSTPAATPEQAAQSEALSALSDRQEQVAEAMGALAEGNLGDALEAVQAMQAEAVAQLAQDLDSLPQIDPSGAMQQAARSSEQAAQSSEAAAEQAAQGQQAAAAPQHAQASQQLSQTAEQLAKAAQSLSQAAEAAAAQASNEQQAPVSPSDLAAAAQQAAQAAASEEQAAGAEAAQQAAQSLAQAAEAARSEMSGQPKPPGNPGMPQPGMPGDEPSEDPSRPAQADPGVPPELAKLGISAADWEKISASLTSDKSGAGVEGVPAEYRGLVKGYFQSMSQK